MSMMSDIKFLVKKYLKNPVLVAAAAYLLYKSMNKWLKKESFAESIQVIEDDDKKPHAIIYDDKLKKYILICNNKVYSSEDKDELKTYANSKMKANSKMNANSNIKAGN